MIGLAACAASEETRAYRYPKTRGKALPYVRCVVTGYYLKREDEFQVSLYYNLYNDPKNLWLAANDFLACSQLHFQLVMMSNL